MIGLKNPMRGIPQRASQFRQRVVKDFIRHKTIYFMAIPVIAYYVLFHYMPMFGAQIAFKDFSPGKGIMDSPWVGFKHFTSFFEGVYFSRVVLNTIFINLYGLIFGFPAPIILALLLNELRSNRFKRLVQTISYLPHFISIMVICGMILDFTSTDGLVNQIIAAFGGTREPLMLKPELFKGIYVGTDIWQQVGWGSIIYLAALTGIDSELYEAAVLDGAGRWKQMLNITLPGIAPTIIILLILRIGQMMNVGFEKIILLYNPVTYSSADVISSFVYRKGLMEFSYSFSTAVGLFNSLINFLLLISANALSKKYNETSLF